VAKYLHTNEAINAYMEEAMETDDPAFIAQALGTIARARGMFRDGSESVCRPLDGDYAKTGNAKPDIRC
jgi:probable addiction module antidote protein